MKVEDTLNPQVCDYRRNSKVKFFYAVYPNGDFFESSGNGNTIMFKSKRGLMQNIKCQVNELYNMFEPFEDAATQEEFFEKYLSYLTIKEISE